MSDIKPGDLCIIVRPVSVEDPFIRRKVQLVAAGTIVRVVRFDVRCAWVLETLLSFDVTFSDGTRAHGRINGLGSGYLQPLRDPGDDAVDEVVQRAGSPRLDEVPLQ